jgi:asparagine synthase (glutamine-hydrolysing)
MCGINGATKVDEALVAKMNAATRHRGPDGSSLYHNERCTFGHNRLAIIDLSARSNQPMVSHDGRYVIVFNGEIYNFSEIKRELVGVPFKTNGDTEVLLEAYARWGVGCLAKLRGIFAFAIYDRDTGSVTLVRDHVGVKPLYYAVKNGVLFFSSELQGLIAAGFKTLNRTAAGLFLLSQYVPSPLTLLEGVSKLEPRQYLVFSQGEAVVHHYPTTTDYGDNAGVLAVIDDAVKTQLVSDRPVGLYLSGGMDSTILLHHLSAVVPDLQTFTLRFGFDTTTAEQEARFNFDADMAARSAKQYGVRHTELTLTSAMVADQLMVGLSNLDEPVANPTIFTRYVMSKWVRDLGVVVAFGGDGGDEYFLGYPRYRRALAAAHYQHVPSALRAMAGHLSSQAAKLNTKIDLEFHHQLMLNTTPAAALVSPELASQASQLLRDVLEQKYVVYADGLRDIDAYIEVDRHVWLSDESLIGTDKATMAHGLEYRVPLLDQRVIAFACSQPRHKQLRYDRGKLLLRQAYQSLLPPHVFTSQKRGWLSPAAKWLRDPAITQIVSQVLSPDFSSQTRSLANWDAVNRLLSSHCAGEANNLNPLWNLLQLQVWSSAHGLSL